MWRGGLRRYPGTSSNLYKEQETWIGRKDSHDIYHLLCGVFICISSLGSVHRQIGYKVQSY